jgi:type II secretory pathway component PulF
MQRFSLWGAWGQRADFYIDLAQAVREKELLLDFVNAELKIAKSRRTRNKDRAALMEAIRVEIRRGNSTLSEALPMVMPDTDTTTLRVLADARNPASVLENLAQAVRDQAQITSVVRTALLQPILVSLAGTALAYVLAVFVFPAVTSSAKIKLIGLAGYAAATASIIANNIWYAVAILTALLVFTNQIILPRATGRWRFVLEDLSGISRLLARVFLLPIYPQIEIYREYRSVIMINNLAVLLQAGKDLLTSLDLVGQTGNPWERHRIRQCVSTLRRNPGQYVMAFEPLLSGPVLQKLATTVRRGKADFATELIKGAASMREAAEKNVASTMSMINKLIIFAVLGTNIFLYAGMVFAVMQLRDALTK